MNPKRRADIRPDNTPAVEVKILDERIHAWGLPAHHSEMAAALDLFACVEEPMTIHPGGPAELISSGIAVHIGDPQFAGLVIPRSGLGHRGLVLGNLVGLLDADYTGPLLISAWNRNQIGSTPISIAPGDRIAQLVFVPVVRPSLRVVTEFTKESKRGAGGFGSTGLVAG